MSKERYNQIIDDIYNLYAGLISLSNCVALNPQAISEEWAPDITEEMSKEDFIKKIKIDKKFTEEFAESLGIEFKIEEHELSLEERHNIALPIWKEKYGALAEMMVKINIDNTPYKIPTKQITLTYQNESIQFYE